MTIADWDVRAIIEGILFVADKPLTAEDVAEVLLKQYLEAQEEAEEAAAESAKHVRTEEPTDAEVNAALADALTFEALPDEVQARDAQGVEALTIAPQLDLAALQSGGEEMMGAALDAGAPEEMTSEEAASQELSLEGDPAEVAVAEVATDDNVREGIAEEAVLAEAGAVADLTGTEGPVANEDVASLLPPEPLSEAVLRKELIALAEEAFRGLAESYQDDARQVGRGFELVHVAGAYQLRTRAMAGAFIRQFLQAKPTRLSRAQLETLAIIAYRQPVTKPGIEMIRGVDCANAVRVLLERKLVRILGKAEEVGRPLLYGTSREFLEFFRLNSLLELPTLREFQELSEEHRKRVEDELDQAAPLGSLADLAESAPKLASDDAEMLGSLDQALASAKSMVQRVAEITGLKAADESDESAPR